MILRYLGNTEYKIVQSVPGIVLRPGYDIDLRAVLALRSSMCRATQVILLSACVELTGQPLPFIA
jgi:hypothetical protein